MGYDNGQMQTKGGQKAKFYTQIKPNIKFIAFCCAFVDILAAAKP